MSDSFVDSMDRWIKQKEIHLDRIRAIRDSLAEDPTIRPVLVDMLLNPEPRGRLAPVGEQGVPPTSRTPAAPGVDENLAKLLNYIKSRGPGAMVSIAEVQFGTGLNRSNLNYWLGDKYRDFFESVKVSGSRLFRLRDSAGEPASIPTHPDVMIPNPPPASEIR
jgi:hypothetical protein